MWSDLKDMLKAIGWILVALGGCVLLFCGLVELVHENPADAAGYLALAWITLEVAGRKRV